MTDKSLGGHSILEDIADWAFTTYSWGGAHNEQDVMRWLDNLGARNPVVQLVHQLDEANSDSRAG